MEKGISTVVRHASPEFAHVVLCLGRSGESARLLPAGTRVLELGKRPGHSAVFLLRLARELRRLRPALVHTRNWGGLDGVIAARLAGLPVVHGEHGWTMDDPDGLSPRRLRLRRWLNRWVREYTCVSAEMERWLRGIVGDRRVSQIYNGVDARTYAPSPDRGSVRRELGIAADAFVVTICGRLDPIKDHVTLLRAFAALLEADAGARLLVVGDGPERKRLEGQAGTGVLFLGNRTDVPAILGDTDVFALTSLNEGISNTILEAMASGLPVVATRVGGNGELVEHGVSGSLVAPGDRVAITAVLLAYRRDRERRLAQGAAGRRRAVERFPVAAMVEAYQRVYLRAASRQR